MHRPFVQALRFARGWSSPPAGLREEDVEVLPADGGPPVRGSLWSPAGDGPLPGWVVMHGVTRLGRRHPVLRRFVGALASTGTRVLVPEVAEWTRLELAPARAQSILRGAVRTLAGHPRVNPGGVVLAGFSFGGPQVLHAAASDEAGPSVRGVLVWGSYADLGRTLHFHFTGEHGFDEGGRPRHVERPDPYGRWVVGYNCLPLLAGRGNLGGVADALHELAALAGDRAVGSRSPEIDERKTVIRDRLALPEREYFDLFAPPRNRRPERDRAVELIGDLVPAALEAFPLLDPLPDLGPIRAPVRLMHGRGDVLIPYTETEALEAFLSPRVADLGVGITGLFGHSESSGATGSRWARTRDALHFIRVLRRAFEIA